MRGGQRDAGTYVRTGSRRPLEDALTDAVSGDLLEVTGQRNGEYDVGLAGPLTVRGGRGADSAELSGYVGLDAVRLSRVTISDAR